MKIESLTYLKNFVESSNSYCGNSKIISIDGPAGSGKTTLSKSLQNKFLNCFVIHMDEIYEGWENALSGELFQNLENWIIKPIKENSPIIYYKYDWVSASRQQKVEINDYKFIIIEGVGSSNLRTRTYSCLKIWIEANPAITLNRVLNRDGQHILEEMKTWQEKEKSYFAQHEVKNHSDIWVDGNFSQELDTSTHFKLVNR